MSQLPKCNPISALYAIKFLALHARDLFLEGGIRVQTPVDADTSKLHGEKKEELPLVIWTLLQLSGDFITALPSPGSVDEHTLQQTWIRHRKNLQNTFRAIAGIDDLIHLISICCSMGILAISLLYSDPGKKIAWLAMNALLLFLFRNLLTGLVRMIIKAWIKGIFPPKSLTDSIWRLVSKYQNEELTDTSLDTPGNRSE